MPYETFSLEMKGVSKRSAFVIDKEGNIRYAEVLENAGEQPDFTPSLVVSKISTNWFSIANGDNNLIFLKILQLKCPFYV